MSLDPPLYDMAERTDQRTRERDVGVDVDTDLGGVLDDDATMGGTATTGGERSTGRSGLRGRISERVDSIFSVRTFAITLLLTVALAFVAGAFVPILPGSALLGVFAGGFLLGVGSDRRRYLEVGAATLLSGAVTALLGNLVLTVLGAGVPLVAVGAGASGVAGLAGHYFGRDLRAGLTQDL